MSNPGIMVRNMTASSCLKTGISKKIARLVAAIMTIIEMNQLIDGFFSVRKPNPYALIWPNKVTGICLLQVFELS